MSTLVKENYIFVVRIVICRKFGLHSFALLGGRTSGKQMTDALYHISENIQMYYTLISHGILVK